MKSLQINTEQCGFALGYKSTSPSFHQPSLPLNSLIFVCVPQHIWVNAFGQKKEESLFNP
jgi:hypothetical protein